MDYTMNRRTVVLFAVVLAAPLFASSAQAQRHGGGGFSGRGMGFSHGGAVRARGIRLRRSTGYFGDNGFGPYFYSDFDPGVGLNDAPAPQYIVQQAPPAPVQHHSEPMLLELQDDHWARITNGGSQAGAQLSEPTPSGAKTHRTSESESLPPATLVFRDGHQEQIGKYMIVGSTIFTRTDFWTSGSWTRKVEVAELDIPATLKLNQQRGAKFSLPSGPNEVMIRP
jgi:hypothetical protein